MVRYSTCNEFHMRKLCRSFYWSNRLILSSSIIGLVQRPRSTMTQVLLIAFAIHWLCLGFVYWLSYINSFMLLLHMKLIVRRLSPNYAEFPIVCMIWYGWIQSPSVSNRQGVRWYGFRWSITISIDYIQSLHTYRAITTLRYSYCMWNSFINTKAGKWHVAANDLSCSTAVKC